MELSNPSCFLKNDTVDPLRQLAFSLISLSEEHLPRQSLTSWRPQNLSKLWFQIIQHIYF